ncbi:Gfo/Idh/MocA family protein [Jiulongibacter sediminis]|uniref:Gfo/Idh/MocA family protein n=1 Tax=Jiulongibacter sediminis TaxID=1605367 RepID=UPI0026EAC767|nr:Gfo/Idh/MocA family oxidoreductase [Jiulongibacter sediminis]
MKNRREFLKKLGGTAAGLAIGTAAQAEEFEFDQRTLVPKIKSAANDKIQIGLIGSGIIGHYDTDTALKVEGVELVAVCDLYDGRLQRAREKWGNQIFTTRDYRELLARPDIDAVLICTPDHWHQKIAIDAMKAGKHVYCEKPMVQKIEEGKALVDAQKSTGKVFQVGSQRASSVAVLEAKRILEAGTIGELTYVEAFCDRSESRGAWQYSIPTDASPENIDFDTFLGHAPKIPFNAERFFRWRNFKDYGTGAAGDLIVHLLTGIHTMTGSIGPNRIFSLAELNYWKDGRDAYDLINAVMDYPERETHPSFQVMTRVNLADGDGKGGFGIKMIGTDGVIDIGWNEFTVRTLKRHTAPGYGGYDSFDSFSAKQKEEFKKWYNAKYGDSETGYTINKETRFDPPQGYDDRLDHMIVFFNAIRGKGQILEDAAFGFRAAAPSIACNLSAEKRTPIYWNPEKMILEG